VGETVTAAIYARVSTEDQTTEPQLSQLRRLAPGALEFVDDAISGVRDHRPQLDRLRQAMLRREISEVYVTKVDRLGRSLQMLLRFWDEAEANAVRIVVVDQGIDTGTAAGRFQRNMLAAVAEFERELILERTRVGVERARRSGKRFGRPPKFTEDQRAEIRRRLTAGESSRKVSMALKISDSTVRWIGKGCPAKKSHPRTGPSAPSGHPGPAVRGE